MPAINALTIVAMVDTYTGYGQLFCELFAGLEKRGVTCAVRPIVEKTIPNTPTGIPLCIREAYVRKTETEKELLIAPSDHFHRPTPGKDCTYFTMSESSGITPKQVAILNLANRVVVPCQWNKEGFERSGVKVPIYVVPLGVRTELFEYSPMNTKGLCVFGAGGLLKYSGNRKKIQQVVDVFKWSFAKVPDVRLELKLMPGDELADPGDDRIIVLRHVYDWNALYKWYRSLTAYVCVSRGEGWGLMPHQAMAVGRPVIGPLFGGLREFMDAENSYPVWPFLEWKEPGDRSQGYVCNVDNGELQEQMRRIYYEREEAAEIGAIAAKRAAQFTWDNTCEKLLEVLHA